MSESSPQPDEEKEEEESKPTLVHCKRNLPNQSGSYVRVVLFLENPDDEDFRDFNMDSNLGLGEKLGSLLNYLRDSTEPGD